MASTSRKIKLMSTDGETFVVEEAVAAESQTIKSIIEDGYTDGVIPLPKITGKTLSKVIEYCKKHVNVNANADDGKPSADDLKAWDSEFVNVHPRILFDLASAANHLKVKKLLDLTCQTIADMIKGKNVEEMRRILHIENDFTPEEEEEMRREHVWAFD